MRDKRIRRRRQPSVTATKPSRRLHSAAKARTGATLLTITALFVVVLNRRPFLPVVGVGEHIAVPGVVFENIGIEPLPNTAAVDRER
jgi:hypothetical protein